MTVNGDTRLFHFLVQARDALPFWQNIVLVGEDCDNARSKLLAFLQSEHLRLVEFDEEETKEIERHSVPEGWLSNAQPGHGIIAMGGRIWIEPKIKHSSLKDRLWRMFRN